MRLIIATRNKDKFKEIKEIMKGLDIELVSLADLGVNIRIVENGSSFFENARKKAEAVFKKYPYDLVAGDDSGLEVEYLNNGPGIFSKRYSGRNSTYLKNNLKLLKELEGVERKKRKARFRCVVTMIYGKGSTKKFEGKISGYISDKLSGKEGFGYDPLFYVPSYRKTIAQMPISKKNEISHRARAFKKLKKYLDNNLSSLSAQRVNRAVW